MSLLADLCIDLFLLLSFAAVHSALLLPEGRQVLGRLAPRSLQGTVYALASSSCLLMTILCWRVLPGVVYELEGPAKLAMTVAYGLAWAMMGWAMMSTGALKQCGIEQWMNTLRGRPTRYDDPRGGAYRLMRHPIYFGMMGMIWLTPKMTTSHLLLALVWTGYMVLGASWKEGRMLRRAGDYADYARRVPPFPFWPRQTLAETLTGRCADLTAER